MLRHIVFVKFKAGVTAAQVEEMKKALGGLPGKIAEIRGWASDPTSFGPSGPSICPRGRLRKCRGLEALPGPPGPHPGSHARALLSEVLQVADFNLQ